MMKSKNFPIYLICIACLLIFSGFVSSFIISLKNYQAVVLKRMGNVNNIFEEFSTNVSLYEEKRDLLYTNYLSNLYYDTMYNNNAIIKGELTSYENLVKEIDEQRKVLDTLCVDVYYPDSAANSKCSNYKSIYEQVINYFVTDINYYNNGVDEYNNYIKQLNGNNLISNYNTNFKYIDYNNDKKYDGKED